jgi:hypothetical protein
MIEAMMIDEVEIGTKETIETEIVVETLRNHPSHRSTRQKPIKEVILVKVKMVATLKMESTFTSQAKRTRTKNSSQSPKLSRSAMTISKK